MTNEQAIKEIYKLIHSDTTPPAEEVSDGGIIDMIFQIVAPIVEGAKPFSNAIRMRDDLAEEGLAVPASKSFKDYDTQVDVVYIGAEELQGATYGDDPAHPDEHPFCYVELKDGRSLYFIGVDLDFGEVTTNLSIV